MTNEPKPESRVPTGGDGGDEPPPPFEPDEDLITYLEKGREPKGEKR
ncbi:MAG: hypothetical protein ACRDK3_08380 [Actinomycetota bacterium]